MTASLQSSFSNAIGSLHTEDSGYGGFKFTGTSGNQELIKLNIHIPVPWQCHAHDRIHIVTDPGRLYDFDDIESTHGLVLQEMSPNIDQGAPGKP